MTPRKLNMVLKAALALLVIATVGGLYIANSKLTHVAQETARLKADVQVADMQTKVYQQNKSQIDSLSYVNSLADKVLPATEDQSTVIAELSTYADRSSLRISQITFPVVATGAATKLKTVPAGVKVTPVVVQFKNVSYTGVLSYLKTLESTQRRSQVTNIVLTPDQKDGATLSQVEISLNLYSKQSGVKQ